MRVVIEVNELYFRCSRLPLLNGDIKIILSMHYAMQRPTIDLKSLLEGILKMIVNSGEYKRGSRRIKREYKRMAKLYQFRINLLEYKYL